ncbi:MAG: 50S ribosomal protein L21 [Myxococcota bacterium]|nr:50S ribosomal protein L21 [Myxococcota bacterium]
MYAVVRTGGKQYKVAPEQTFRVEKLPGAVGDTIELGEVLLTSADAVKIGTPRVEGAKVVGTIMAQGRGPKIVIFKLKRRKNYRRKQGHRQDYTEIRVDKIEGT